MYIFEAFAYLVVRIRQVRFDSFWTYALLYYRDKIYNWLDTPKSCTLRAKPRRLTITSLKYLLDAELTSIRDDYIRRHDNSHSMTLNVKDMNYIILKYCVSTEIFSRLGL